MKKYFQTKNFLVIIIAILVIVILLMLFGFFSKERLFKKDLECLQSVRSVERYKNEASIVFYSTKKNTCIYIVAPYESWGVVYDLSDRSKTIAEHCNTGSDTSKCEGSLDEFIQKIKKEYR